MEQRVFIMREGSVSAGPVVYWMSRDQRAQDNWSLLYAQSMAVETKSPLYVVFCLVPRFGAAETRHYDFMIKGLSETESRLRARIIPLQVMAGRPVETLPAYLNDLRAALLVTDFDPLRIKRDWTKAVLGQVSVPVHEVDSHNIVPCRIASQKAEYGAYTLRPKINRLKDNFLTEFPRVRKHPFNTADMLKPVDWEQALRTVKCAASRTQVDWISPGFRAADRMLKDFIRLKLPGYAETRNDPTRDGQSNLSPFLHFGQISAQRVAWEAQQSGAPEPDQEAFLEELIVRRELSDNFCHYHADYDKVSAFPGWARKSLAEHEADPRPYLYPESRLESAETHDELWNAAQKEMMQRGKMHGYMRMYWAKKILEWSEDAEKALSTAIRLNDRYSLDGRDPNGYAGVAWSIGGVHDRAWPSRPIFGKVRYMSEGGARAKFRANLYVRMQEEEKRDSP
ncbi:deoxyribodipyrimidine photo-lyase [bacterium]|nr:deoxyribodipyrimidine photo-lyase [bacterium]